MRKVAIIPTLFTLGNAACGFVALIFAARISVAGAVPAEVAAYVSGWLIIVAMGFDVLDGYVARRVKSASQFGAELDSLCDAISFGAAPGFLLVQLGASLDPSVLQAVPRVQEAFLIVAVLFMTCAILRLARFNVQTTLDAESHKFFRGLPSPAAAGCVASLVVLRYKLFELRLITDETLDALIPWLALVGGLSVALLMVSRVPYLHFANLILRRRHKRRTIILMILALAVCALLRELVPVLLFWAYALISPLRGLVHRAWPRKPAIVTVEGPPPSLPFPDPRVLDEGKNVHGSR